MFTARNPHSVYPIRGGFDGRAMRAGYASQGTNSSCGARSSLKRRREYSGWDVQPPTRSSKFNGSQRIFIESFSVRVNRDPSCTLSERTPLSRSPYPNRRRVEEPVVSQFEVTSHYSAVRYSKRWRTKEVWSCRLALTKYRRSQNPMPRLPYFKPWMILMSTGESSTAMNRHLRSLASTLRNTSTTCSGGSGRAQTETLPRSQRMTEKRRQRLVREGEPSQKTDKGLEIPVPTEPELFGVLDRAIQKEPKKPSARSGRGKRRPSRAR
jgi:hypothetical protein